MPEPKNKTPADLSEVELSRDLGLFSVTMMGVGGMIGAGIFALSGIAAGVAGPAVVLVFILNGAITFLTALAYAELGAAFPRAGGGYVWVKEGLGGGSGFLAGWMSWFGYVVAGALYALAFGGFALDGWHATGLPTGGLSDGTLSTIFSVVVIVVFTGLNFLGSKEAGAMGAAITVVKIAILCLFIAFGAAVMFSGNEWQYRFFDNFMPKGVAGVLAGMGLTFIAFEGYEIIAQSGEEIIKPARNVPRGIFLSIAIAIVIYVAVGIVAVGAITPPPEVAAYQYLGAERELAIVSVARQVFPWGTGGALMLISGLAATISALNVTVFSAARVSFAMGREHNLPPIFARIHARQLTPYVAVITTGALMLVAALTLPIEAAATAGGIMFLLMFIQVNMAVIALRRTRPEVTRSFRIPLFPLPAIIGIVVNGALVLYTISVNPTAVWTAFAWIVAGLLAYYVYFEHEEERGAPRTIVHEEAIGKHGYTVLVGVRNEAEAVNLGWFAAALAKARDGGLLAAEMLEVPPPLSLNEGRALIKSGKKHFETIKQAGDHRNVGTHSLIMVARRVAGALESIVAERDVDFIVLGWSGAARRGRSFGRTIDPLLASPPADMAVVRPATKPKAEVKTILVAVDDGPNSRLAVELATDLGQLVAGRAHAAITVMCVTRTKTAAEAGEPQLFERLLKDIDYGKLETVTRQGTSRANTIIEEAENFDLVILGAGETSRLSRLLGHKPDNRFTALTSKRVLREASPMTVMVKHCPALLRSFLQRTLFPS